MAKVNKTKYALLGVLNLMSGSGYDIKKFCDSSIGHFWNENFGHIYPVLQKMEQDELVTKKVEQTKGKPDKNVYSITVKGKNELEEWLKLPIEREPFRSELLLKIFMSKDIPIEYIIKHIQEVKERNEEEYSRYSEIETSLKAMEEHIGKKNLVLINITLNNGKLTSQAVITWCEETLKTLNEIKDL